MAANESQPTTTRPPYPPPNFTPPPSPPGSIEWTRHGVPIAPPRKAERKSA